MIIGDISGKEIPSLEIQNWLRKYWEISIKNKITLKIISGFYVALAEISVKSLWIEYLHDNVKAEIIYPPILSLKVNRGELALENGAYDTVRKYSKDIVEFIINNEK